MLNLVVLGLVIAAVAPVAALRSRAQGGSGWRRWAGLGLAVLLALAVLCLIRVDVRKVVASAVMPFGIVWFSLIAFTADSFFRGNRLAGCLTGSLVVVMAVAGNPQLATTLVRTLEEGIPTDDGQSRFDAVLVLGGATSIGRGGPELNGSGDRIRLAAQLWRTGRTPVLVTSGASIPTMDRERSLADETAQMWAAMGVPEANILRLRSPTLINTEAELAAYRDEATARGWSRLGLVTSAGHMRRALVLCNHLGLHVTPLAADWRGGTGDAEGGLLMPRAAAMAGVEYVLWEYLGSLKPG